MHLNQKSSSPSNDLCDVTNAEPSVFKCSRDLAENWSSYTTNLTTTDSATRATSDIYMYLVAGLSIIFDRTAPATYYNTQVKKAEAAYVPEYSSQTNFICSQEGGVNVSDFRLLASSLMWNWTQDNGLHRTQWTYRQQHTLGNLIQEHDYKEQV